MFPLQIIQKRVDGQQDFNQDWRTYEQGFGDINHGYWIGKTDWLINFVVISTSRPVQKRMVSVHTYVFSQISIKLRNKNILVTSIIDKGLRKM